MVYIGAETTAMLVQGPGYLDSGVATTNCTKGSCKLTCKAGWNTTNGNCVDRFGNINYCSIANETALSIGCTCLGNAQLNDTACLCNDGQNFVDDGAGNWVCESSPAATSTTNAITRLKVGS